MILSRAHDFGFVHIGKCAGSTIRQQLREIDDLGGRFYHTMQVEGLGRINGNHVPLRWLADHFPDDFAALRAVQSYTITREPMDRFISSLAQRIRAQGREPGDMSPREIRAEAETVMADLGAVRSGFPPSIYTIFYRQIDYVRLDGEQILTRVFPMENLDALFDLLESRHGLSLIRDKVWNPTVTYRHPALSGPLKRIKDTAKALLPMKSYVALRELGVKAFTTKGAPKLTETLMGSAAVTAFVADYYREDAALHAAARAPFRTAAAS
jgi:hypothetical protein